MTLVLMPASKRNPVPPTIMPGVLRLPLCFSTAPYSVPTNVIPVASKTSLTLVFASKL